ncbi:MAG: DEAD/DEAH box helicase [Acetobacteraceae bacterium]
MLDAAASGEHAVLIAPTGGGKTLAGFLPSLVDLAAAPRPGLHTLYISPLKALATDIARNLTAPVSEMALPVTIETRSGDTPANRRVRQKAHPPNILLTTPESLALLVSQTQAAQMFEASPASSWTRCMRWPAPSAATSWRSAWRGWRSWRPARAGSGCRRRSRTSRRFWISSAAARRPGWWRWWRARRRICASCCPRRTCLGPGAWGWPRPPSSWTASAPPG